MKYFPTKFLQDENNIEYGNWIVYLNKQKKKKIIVINIMLGLKFNQKEASKSKNNFTVVLILYLTDIWSRI